MSLYQYKRFKALGFNVGITRTEDTSIEPNERVSMVKDKAKYCISNHINAGGGDGLEIIKSIYNKSDEADYIAKLILQKGQNLRRVFSKKNSDGKDWYYMHRLTGSTRTYIMEYGFVDSKLDDPQQLKERWKDYAEAVIEAFCSIYGKPYTKELNSSDISKQIEIVQMELDKLKTML